MIAALFMAGLIAAAPSPAPTSSVPCGGQCFAGIGISDDKYRVLAKLDSHPLPGSDERIMGDYNTYPNGLMLTVYYQKAIVAVMVTYVGQHGKTNLTDPYGVKLDDTSDHLTVLRGKPDTVDGSVWRYGPLDGIHWDYTIENGIVTTILLSSVPKLS